MNLEVMGLEGVVTREVYSNSRGRLDVVVPGGVWNVERSRTNKTFRVPPIEQDCSN